ncbi:DNA alkylation repair protein [Alkalibacterium pelagium]|uniref:3-methyladenine DNA glycosylase AlkD n=1 Tax=Alkalibacterium pelagium TaxID=426702 RepID=A0A1H7JP80_9LACT|nr:DNA alkylation repair protein [Alkalibacterium pelagium]GEN50608.1 DNA alkylation repair protein [Alkalibacterium pelagium]SEK75730.1 3-methyladenine DNA glycosylase AlkD [Alkalibacterium pelagium]
MDRYELIEAMERYRDPVKAVQMKKYMKDQFKFLGLQSVKRRDVSRPFLSSLKNSALDWQLVFFLWEQPYREYQYIACDYLLQKKDDLSIEDVDNIRQLALDKSWWDTIDNLDKLIGTIALKHPELNDSLLDWSKEDNIWLRRIAIDHQRMRKKQTDTVLLEQIIVNNLNQTEFFINKAIGWSLRDYSKTDPKWVRRFIETHRQEMAPLSVREASKYL